MNGYLLDTVIFLWSFGSTEKLNRQAMTVLEDNTTQLFLSAASSWEISIKSASGKLKLPERERASTYVPKRLRSHGIRSLPISHIHALAAGELPRYHADPFDRMLIAQAMSDDMVLMTSDPTFRKYSIDILWCGT
jgi:PIN domain nuclease of toxin-antitoxin system